MYITVKFGESEESIFNPNCRCVSLLNTIKERCQCEWDLDIDLSDESGNVKNLRDNPHRYATEILGERESLVLIRIDRKDTGDTDYIPLLNNTDILTEAFLTQLASKQKRPNSRRIKSSKSRPGQSPTKGVHGDKEKGGGNKNNKSKDKVARSTSKKGL